MESTIGDSSKVWSASIKRGTREKDRPVAFRTPFGGLRGGGGASPTEIRSVTIRWTANRESGVNSVGGGYKVFISGRPEIDVPYTSGAAAPTSATVPLATGTYTVTIRAYAALDAAGGTSGSLSAPSAPLAVTVP